MKRLVSLFDVHIPDQIDLSGVMEFIKDFKPHILILGGDFMDFDYLSSWSQHRVEYFLEDKPREQYDNDIKMANGVLDKLDKYRIQSGAELHYLEGNHEERLRRLYDKFPDKSRTIYEAYDYKSHLHLKERGYSWHSYNQVVKKGRLYFTHGVYHNKYHTAKHGSIYNRNLRYGHLHGYQAWSMISPIDHHEKIVKAIPCLCHKNPHYMKDRPNAWQNGFHYAVMENGKFFESVPHIIHGQFRAEGKTYKAR